MATQLAGMASFLQNLRVPENANPVTVILPSPPALVGPLAQNNWLAKAAPFAQNKVTGPESMVIANGYVYTGLRDGWVVEVTPNSTVRGILRMSLPSCGMPNAREDACGRPLGIRTDINNYLIVADAYNGIFRIHPQNGRYQHLVDARNTKVKDRQLGFINDLVVTKDGTIFFTSSSSKWTSPKDYLKIILEGETSGRVLVFNPRETSPQKRVQELVTHLHFPNGLELSPNEDFLLIAEGGRCRIHRAWIGANSPKRGKIEPFAVNLPGFVDNIRRSPRNTYWVGLSRARHSLKPSVLDTYGNQPRLRGALMGMDTASVMSQASKHGIVVELDANGNIIRSLHDVEGVLYNSVSEIQEENGVLYIGSFENNFIGKLYLNMLPPPIQIPSFNIMTDNTGLTNNTAVTTTPTPPITNPATNTNNNATNNVFAALIATFRNNLLRMTVDQVRDVAVLLVQRLLMTSLDAKRERERAMRAENDLIKLTALLDNLKNTTKSTGGTTAAPATGESTTTAVGRAVTTAVSQSKGTTRASAVTTSAPAMTTPPSSSSTTSEAQTTTTTGLFPVKTTLNPLALN